VRTFGSLIRERRSLLLQHLDQDRAFSIGTAAPSDRSTPFPGPDPRSIFRWEIQQLSLFRAGPQEYLFASIGDDSRWISGLFSKNFVKGGLN
jgi:hypothetical protein